MLENPEVSDGTPPNVSHPQGTVAIMESDKPHGEPDNQQGRLEAYLSGFVDGEGSFSVGVTRRPDLEFGFQLVPEFRVSQNSERARVLEILRQELGCGRIVYNDRRRPSDRSMVLVVRRRSELLERVIPFFDRNPLLSDKQRSYVAFRTIVKAMAAGRHLTRTGFNELVRLAFTMNGEGRYRKWRLLDVIGDQNPQRLHAEPSTVVEVKIQSELHGDMQSQAEMSWPPTSRGGE